MKTKILIGFTVGLILSFIGIFTSDLMCMWIGGLFVGGNISILSLVKCQKIIMKEENCNE
jgi:hypothetical protein